MKYKNMEFDVGLIGNGFDLHCGLKTNYSDFYEMIKLVYNSKNFNDYKDRLRYKYNEQLDVVDLVRNHGADDLYNMIEKECHDNYFVNYFLNYNSSFNKWTDFESELKNIIDCFYELKKWILEEKNYNSNNNDINVYIYSEEDYKKEKSYHNKNDIYYPFMNVLPQCKLYTYRHSDSLGSMHDRIILHTKSDLIAVGSEYISQTRIKDFLDNEYIQYFYKELIAFESLFAKYLQAFVEPFFNKNLLASKPKFNSVITYNYTKTFEYSLFPSDICHIHGTFSLEKNNILFGIDSKFKYGDNFDWFLKANRRLINGTDYSKLRRIITTSIQANRELAIFGHSLNIADEDTLKFILKQEWAKIVVFFPKNIKFSKENLCRNLRHLLGDEMFENHVRDNILSFQEIV